MTEESCDLVSPRGGRGHVPVRWRGLHHHDVGGENGRPHNDLNPVYFADVDPRDGMVSLRGDLVDLKSGRRLQENMPVIRHVRAVSILYYTANPPWHRGDGGQTGLYERRSNLTDRPRRLWRRSTTPSWHSSAHPTRSIASFRTGFPNVTRSRCGCTAPTGRRSHAGVREPSSGGRNRRHPPRQST